MAIIHKQPFNFVLRSVFYPFRSFLPEKYYFAIDGKIKIRLSEDKHLIFKANPTSNLLRVLFWKGYAGFEPNEYKIFVALVKKSSCFFDVGANIGYYSIVAKLFNPNILVHGFEPLPSARKYFQENVKLNKFPDINISEIALSDTNGQARFYANWNPRFPEIKDHLFGDNSLNRNFAKGIYRQTEIVVQTLTLDDYVSSKLDPKIKIDFIKMDTEGTENLVLSGGKRILEEHKPIFMCEVVRGFVEEDMERLLKDFNYKYYRVKPKGLIPASSLREHEGKEDYFLVPKGKEKLIEDLVLT